MDLSKESEPFQFEVGRLQPKAKPAWNRSKHSAAARDRANPWLAECKREARAELERLGSAAPHFAPGVPLILTVEFFLARPASHSNRGQLIPEAPDYPTTKPDLTNLVKGLEDAIAGIAYRDDQQIVEHVTRKMYATAEFPPGAIVRIETLDPC